jgi:hypothetical protein
MLSFEATRFYFLGLAEQLVRNDRLESKQETIRGNVKQEIHASRADLKLKAKPGNYKILKN